MLVQRGTSDEAQRRWLARRGLREILVAPLRGESGATAVLAVVDRLGEARGLDHEDARLLETVANHAAIALENGRLVDRLRYDSQHDALTGLPNRLLLQRTIDERVTQIPDGQTLVVGVLDLDNFKDVNDTLGHEPGDELLRVVAARLVTGGGHDTVIARLGGDEFAVVYYADPDRVRDNAEALIKSLHRTPVVLNGIEVEVGGSLGITTTHDSGSSREMLLKHADAAMYRAKTNDEDVCVWEPDPSEASVDRLALVSKLRTALQNDALEVFVQPKVELATGRLVSLEALVRWVDPDRGEIAPDEFVSLAERSGLIRPLTDAVLQKAIAACAGWQPTLPGVGIAVNVSVKNLTHDALIERVSFLLRRYGLPPQLLTLEITESSVMSDPARILEVLRELHELGVQLSIDDFGTGYSSLAYLQRLPVQEVKIDRSFVTGISRDRDKTAIARSIIELATALQLRVVAEGVESDADWAQLRQLDCAVAQGYLIARPMPVDDVESVALDVAALACAGVRGLSGYCWPEQQLQEQAVAVGDDLARRVVQPRGHVPLAVVDAVEAAVEAQFDVDRRDAAVVDGEVGGAADAAGHPGDVAHDVVEQQRQRAAVRRAVAAEIEPRERHVPAQPALAALLDHVRRQHRHRPSGDVGTPAVPALGFLGLVRFEQRAQLVQPVGDLGDELRRQHGAGDVVLQPALRGDHRAVRRRRRASRRPPPSRPARAPVRPGTATSSGSSLGP